MSKQNSETGVYQLKNGCWAYRFIIKINGKNKIQRRSKGEDGKPFKTEKQAAKARKKAILFVALHIKIEVTPFGVISTWIRQVPNNSIVIQPSFLDPSKSEVEPRKTVPWAYFNKMACFRPSTDTVQLMKINLFRTGHGTETMPTVCTQ